MTGIALAARFARRELRSGLSGFRIFFACLFLGVASIAAVGSLSEALLTGLAEKGRVLLGGDVSVELVHRPLTGAEHAFAAMRGATSDTASLRAMAYALRNGEAAQRTLIELKAVDAHYPLYGDVGLSPAQSPATALACTPDGMCGAAVEQALLDRLGLARGDLLRIGEQRFRATAVLTDEPDRLSGGFSLGPHALVSQAALARTGLVVTGSLITYDTRVKLKRGVSIASFKADAARAFPQAGWQIRDRDHAAPGTSNFIKQASMFLTLAGLTALAVAGVGAGQAVRAFLERKREEIATFKALGAEGGTVFLMFLLQVMAVATLASFAGVIAGAVVPFIVERVAQIATPAIFGIYVWPLVLAFVFGIVSAAAFAIPPLARAREIAPAGLFRDIVAPEGRKGRWPYLAAAGAAGAAVVALALAISPSLEFSAWFLVGAAGILAFLYLAAAALRFVLARLPTANGPGLRLALANLVRPGAATSAVIVALGLGLSLLATVTLLDRTISRQVEASLPATAPTFFFVDIQPDQVAAFDRAVHRFASVRDYRRTPMIRGRIVALNGTPAAEAKVAPSVRWALNGDRGITYAASPPPDADITAGRWWPANYSGPTLVSFDAELAQGMGLKVGDSLTLNVLGREIPARIANLRDVNFGNGRQNFILILSPGIIDKAPHSFLATVSVARRDEEPLYRAVTDAFPTVSTVRVREVIGQLDALLAELGFAVRAASLVTILAGLLVLAGAIAAGQRTRLYDSTVMKVLGATRLQIARVYAIEYALIGTLTGLLALGFGSAAAWFVTRRLFEVKPVFDLEAVLLTVVGGALATLFFGLGVTWSALAAKPAQLLRNP